jgi:hypothetical protein
MMEGLQIKDQRPAIAGGTGCHDKDAQDPSSEATTSIERLQPTHDGHGVRMLAIHSGM